MAGLLDDPVGLAGDDEAVLGEADVDTLSAAAQREQHPPGRRGRHRPDRHRPLEPTHRAPERLDEGVEVAPAGAEGVGVVAEQGGDHLGVGGDRTGEAQLVLDLEVGVVVDVAVEHADAIRPFALHDLVAVHGVGVGLADDADAGPARVTEHADTGAGTAHRQAQQAVPGHGRPHRCRVVAQLADLRGRLVHERQHGRPIRSARRAPNRTGTTGHRRARRGRRRRRGRRDRARGARRTRGCRPSRDRAPPSGRSPTAPAGSRGSPARAGTDASRPDRASTSRAVRRRSRRIAHSASRSRIDSALAASSASGSAAAPPSARAASTARAYSSSWSSRVVSPATRSWRSARASTPGSPCSASSTASSAAATADGSPIAAIARSRPSSSSAAVGAGRPGSRLTMAMIPHIPQRLSLRPSRRRATISRRGAPWPVSGAPRRGRPAGPSARRPAAAARRRGGRHDRAGPGACSTTPRSAR